MKVKILYSIITVIVSVQRHFPDHITRVKVNATLASNQDPRGRCVSLPGVVAGRSSRRAGGRCVALSHSAVNDKVRAVDEAALVASQEEDCLRLLDSLAETAAGEVDFAAVALLNVVAEPVLEQGCAVFVSCGLPSVDARSSLQRCRAQRVEPEALSGVHHGQLSCQRQNRSLASCVCQLRRGRTDKSNNAGGVDDARLCFSVLAEAQNCMLAAKPYTLDVDSLCQIPDLLWCVDGVVIVGVHYASVVEDDVQAAPRVDVGDDSLNIGLLRDIALLGLNLDFGIRHYFMHLGESPLKRWLRNVGKEDVGALTREENRSLKTDTAVRPSAQLLHTLYFLGTFRRSRTISLCSRGSGEYDEHVAGAAELLLSNSNISPEPKNIHLFQVGIQGHAWVLSSDSWFAGRGTYPAAPVTIAFFPSRRPMLNLQDANVEVEGV